MARRILWCGILIGNPYRQHCLERYRRVYNYATYGINMMGEAKFGSLKDNASVISTGKTRRALGWKPGYDRSRD